MQPPTVMKQQKSYRIFLICLALVLMMLGGVATSRYGAGVASDSVKYMAVAQNMLDGNGLYDHRGNPLLSWPPLYSSVLAGLGFITRLDVFLAGWYLNIFLLGLNLFLSGMIFQRVFETKTLYAHLSSLFVFLSLSSLRVHATIGSDALYLTFTLVFLLVMDDYIQRGSRHAYFWIVILSALAPLLRYIGMAFPVTAALVILIQLRKSPRLMWRDGLILGLVSILPIFWWLVIHNIMTYGSLWGVPSDQVIDVAKNTQLALTKMLHWFVPYLSALMPLLTRPVIILGALIAILVLINIRHKENWLAWVRAFAFPTTYPVTLYAVVYFWAVALTAVTSDHRYLFSDRYYVILLVPVMIFVFITYDKLIQPHLKFPVQQIKWILIALFALWSVYPIYGTREYLAETLERGESSEYNLFNTRAYHEMNVVSAMQKLRASQPDAIFYSNYSDAVWFYTRQPAWVLPNRNIADITTYLDWFQGKPGYIVWFKPNEYKHYLSPQELSQFAILELIYTDESGDIYRVTAR